MKIQSVSMFSDQIIIWSDVRLSIILGVPPKSKSGGIPP